MRLYLFLITIISFQLLSSIFSLKAQGQEPKHSVSSAKLEDGSNDKEDNRIVILREYLEKYDSPLSANASDFIKYADLYALDWKLVASIAGVESTFGKFLPFNSYNAWGYGIYGNNVRYFNSYDEAIAIISKDLAQKYMNEWGARNVYEIGRIYAADPAWANKVNFYMNNITYFANNNAKTLSLSL